MQHKIRIFSDPHIGLNRVSHTTPTSRQALRQAICQTVTKITETPRAVFCLGDLFDTFEVDNQSLLDGYDAMRGCHLVLRGNHDLVNRTDLVSSIQVVEKFSRSSTSARCTAAQPAASEFTGLVGVPIWYVDHKLSQTLFESALDDAIQRAPQNSILFLHCNYDSPFASQESTLNLTRDNAQRLLRRFAHVFIGHQHMPRTDLDGRVILVGNVHPTGFTDISDKFYWDIDITNGAITRIQSELCWSKEKGWMSLAWEDVPEVTRIDADVQFILVTGHAPAEHMPTIARQVAGLWSLSDRLLMVRNQVSSDSLLSATDTNEFAHAVRCESLPDRVSRELAGSPLESIWKDYRERFS